MKRQAIQDERIINQKRKIGSEAFQLVFYVLLASILIQQYMFDAPFSQYAVEVICFFAASAYVVIRNIMVGNDLFTSANSAKKIAVLSSVICGVTVTVINGIFTYTRYGKSYHENTGMFFLALLITFISSTTLAAVANYLLYVSNKKRQDQIDKKLSE